MDEHAQLLPVPLTRLSIWWGVAVFFLHSPVSILFPLPLQKSSGMGCHPILSVKNRASIIKKKTY